MNPYASFQLPDFSKPFLNQSGAAETVRQYWSDGYARLQQSWLRSVHELFTHYDGLLREGQSLQNAALARYLDWTKACSGSSPIASAPSVERSGTRQAAAATPAPPEEETAKPTATPPAKDDLTRLKGVGQVVQERLYSAGVVSFQQIAKWTAEDIARIEDEVLGGRFAGRISRDQWPSQARAFMKQT